MSSTTTPPPPARGDSDMAAVGLMVLAVSTFPLIDTSAKWLVLSFPVLFVAWMRFAWAFVLEWLIVVPRQGLRPLRAPHKWLHIGRSAALAFSSLCNFIAVKHMPLTTTVVILYSVPFIIALLSPMLLRERLARAKWLPVCLGFVGVLLVIQPGLPKFQWEMLWSVATAVLAALYVILTRAVSRVSDHGTATFYTSLVGLVLFFPSVFLLRDFELPSAAWPWVVMFLMGFCFAGCGHQLLIAAQRRAPAPSLAPYMYTNVVLVVLADYLVFANVPDWLTVAGTACAIAAGIWLARLDALARRDAMPRADLPV